MKIDLPQPKQLLKNSSSRRRRAPTIELRDAATNVTVVTGDAFSGPSALLIIVT